MRLYVPLNRQEYEALERLAYASDGARRIKLPCSLRGRSPIALSTRHRPMRSQVVPPGASTKRPSVSRPDLLPLEARKARRPNPLGSAPRQPAGRPRPRAHARRRRARRAGRNRRIAQSERGPWLAASPRSQNKRIKMTHPNGNAPDGMNTGERAAPIGARVLA